MKRAILTGFCSLLLAVALLLILPGILAPRAEAVTVPTGNMYVAKNESAGLMGDVLLFSKGSGKYALYLPGAADAAKLNFSWASSVTVTNEYGVKFVSGKLPVPAPGTSAKYTVNGTVYTVETIQGSEDAKAVVEGLGGKDNINTVENCFTRLRVNVKDVALVRDELIKYL